MLLFLTATILALTGTDAEPAYVIDHPGLAFGSVPRELEEPVEGNLTEEAGVVESAPNETGTEYRVMYWLETPSSSTMKAQWLEERLQTVLPPDMISQLLLGDTGWMEGSLDSPHRDNSSLGLMPTLNFNFVDENGQILGAGRAAACFGDEYAILLYCISPGINSSFVRANFDAMISQMYWSGD